MPFEPNDQDKQIAAVGNAGCVLCLMMFVLGIIVGLVLVRMI